MQRGLVVGERVGGCSSFSLSMRCQALPVAVSLECQTWSSLAAICSMVRPVTTLVVNSSVMGGSVSRALEVVVLFDEEPVGFALVGVLALHADEGPFSLHALAVHDEFEAAGAEAFVDVGVAGLGLPCALIPDHDGASAVLAFGDDAFEAAVLHGVVFDLDGEAFVLDDVAGALGDGPAFEDAVPAEAEVIVEMRGCVLLDDEG